MRSRWQEVFRSLQGEAGAEPPSLAVRTSAAVLASLYGVGARGRRHLYDHGWLKPKRLPCRVLSIGSLTVGGVGKTPLTAFLAEHFQAAGHRVAILSRGYSGRLTGTTVISDGHQIFFKPPQAGDEAYLLAEKLPGIPIVTGGDRYDAGLLAWRSFRPDLILLDDGFQHFQLHRDQDVVLLDARRPFGNGRLLPRGPLREPVSTLDRPLVLVLTRYEGHRDEDTWRSIQAAFPAAAVLRAAFHLSGAIAHPGGREIGLTSLASMNLVAMAGVARPQVFAASLKEIGLNLKNFFPFPDHHPFTPEELAEVSVATRRSGAEGVVTTAKDWVKIAGIWPVAMPLFVVSLEVSLLDPWPENLFPISVSEVETQ